MFKTSIAISPYKAPFAPLLFAGEWRQGISTALKLGYDAIELSLRDPYDSLMPEVFSELKRSGLALSAIATGQSYYQDGLSLTSSNTDERARLFDRLKRFIEFVAPWSGLVILGGVRGVLKGEPGNYQEQRQNAIELIEACSEYASQRGAQLVLEPINRYETNFLNSIQDCQNLIAETEMKNVFILADTFHMNIEEKSISEAIFQAGRNLAYIHFADSNRKAPGLGHINFTELLQTIKHIRYSGYICAEILPIPDSATAAKLAMEFFRSYDLGNTTE